MDVEKKLPDCGMFQNKVILAPMVRIGTLPLRLLALDYGADLVYCEEIVDRKILRSERHVNDVLGTVDYIDKADGEIVFQTTDREKGKVIFQLGTCDPERAAEVAKFIEKDVAGIDINMGCPKKFSIKGGMGAALLSKTDRACEILSSVCKAVQIPVTCKIRVLPDMEKTKVLCEKLAATGISAIAIHGRTLKERSRHPNRIQVIREIASYLKIPVICNGGSGSIRSYEDILEFRREAGCTSAMIARVAMRDCSIFCPRGRRPLDEVIGKYLRHAVDFDVIVPNVKYCVQSMLKELQNTPRGKKFLEAQTMEQLCDIWGLAEYSNMKKKLYISSGVIGRWDISPEGEPPEIKKFKLGENVLKLRTIFIKGNYAGNSDLPKSILAAESRKRFLPMPEYETIRCDKLFHSTLAFDGKKYSSDFWEKNKRWAEQSAAIVCLCYLRIYDMEKLKENGTIR